MTLPEFALSLTRAEGKLIEAIAGSVSGHSTPGVIGTTPTRHGGFAVRMVAPNPADASFWSAHKFPCMAWRAVVAGAFRTREDAQIFLMLIIAALPVKNAHPGEGSPEAGELVQIKISSPEEIIPRHFTEPNEPTPWAWVTTINLDVVFLTGSRDIVSE